MTAGAAIWFIIFGISAGLFFGIALVVTFFGIGELRTLLGTVHQKKTQP